jgi:hypothetical protein
MDGEYGVMHLMLVTNRTGLGFVYKYGVEYDLTDHARSEYYFR